MLPVIILAALLVYAATRPAPPTPTPPKPTPAPCGPLTAAQQTLLDSVWSDILQLGATSDVIEDYANLADRQGMSWLACVLRSRK